MLEGATSALDAAKYLLTLDDPDAGDLMSNLKLQKLLYYAQGVHLAALERPLFSERIEAWDHGPVCPDVYHAFKGNGGGSIPQPDDFDPGVVPQDSQDILAEVHTAYGQFSAWRLREMTHEEPPWTTCYRAGARHVEIPHQMLREYFSTVLA